MCVRWARDRGYQDTSVRLSKTEMPLSYYNSLALTDLLSLVPDCSALPQGPPELSLSA